MGRGKPSPIRRFVVAEESMLPALAPGDGLVAVRSRRIHRGEVRCFEHPLRTGFWLVKRVGHVRHDRFEALSDNPAAGAVDSRRFGDVPIEGSYRVRLRLPASGGRPRRVAERPTAMTMPG